MDMPLDLQIEIFTRLPAKSLMRFKCVSRLWSSLIRSPYFTNLYLTLSSPLRTPRLYVSSLKYYKKKCDSMPIKSLFVSFSSSSSNNVVESFEEEFTMTGMGGHRMFVLRGLILYEVCNKAYVYNPATQQRVMLPAVESNLLAQEEPLKYVSYFLGHDHVLDQYKVVCTVTIAASKNLETIKSEHWVFVLEKGGSWKRIEFDQQPHRATNQGLNPGLCINGVIYYLANTTIYNDIVVSFDVKSEEFNIIQAPRDVAKIGVSPALLEYGGKPAIIDHSNLVKTKYSDPVEYCALMVLWVLEDGGKWSKKSMVLQPCHWQLVDNICGVIVVGTTRNGEVILAPLVEPFFHYILYYDIRKNDLRKVEIRGMPDYPYTDLTLMDKSESIMHLEI